MCAASSFFSRVLQNPVALLLITGGLFGFNFPLGKIAAGAGVSPVVWALLVSLGASGVLFPLLLIKGHLNLPRGRVLRYVVISGMVSFVVPGVLMFGVIPHVGAGFTGLMFALSPVFTLGLAVLFRLKAPRALGVMGIVLGLIGASVVAITRGASPEAPPVMWILAALVIPAFLAIGNIYRTMDWPDGAYPDILAFWCHGFAVVAFLLLLLGMGELSGLSGVLYAPWSALAQVVVAGLTFPVYFRLQQHGGPVLLSQIGYVAAAVGIAAATVLLGERYSLMTWIGTGIVGVGIVATVISQRLDI